MDSYEKLKAFVISQLAELDAGKYKGIKPKISLEEYSDRFKKYIVSSYEKMGMPDEFFMNKVLITASILLDKLLANGDAKEYLETKVGQHRLFATLVMLSIKNIMDDHYKNSSMAEIAGFPVENLNDFESEIFKFLGFNVQDIFNKFEEKQQQILEAILYEGEFIGEFSKGKPGKYEEPPLPEFVQKGKAAFVAASSKAAATASGNSAAISTTNKKLSVFSFSNCMPSWFGKKQKEGLAGHVQPTAYDEPGSPKKKAQLQATADEPGSPKKKAQPKPGE